SPRAIVSTTSLIGASAIKNITSPIPACSANSPAGGRVTTSRTGWHTCIAGWRPTCSNRVTPTPRDSAKAEACPMPKSADALLDDTRHGTAGGVSTTAAVLAAPRHFQLRDAVLPPCAADEVCIALEGCGVCASSLPVWEGRPWFDYPQAAGSPGHEGWGRIIAMGEQARRQRPELAIGRRVTCLG